MRIYIESTIPSYVVARPSRDSIKAMRQQLTKDWWESKRKRPALFVSRIVLEEVGRGELEMARKRVQLLEKVTLLDMTDDAMKLALDVLGSGLLPANAGSDAAHIALATTHKMDILLSWNCKHIANPFIQTDLRRLVLNSGFVLPVLCTPEDLLRETI